MFGDCVKPDALQFAKYHALGNDYFVLSGNYLVASLPSNPALIQRLCHRSYGLGSDGILIESPAPESAPWSLPAFGLRIFNPDGSEAEKSGNGLRIFARWLYDQGRVTQDPFAIWVPGGWVRAQVSSGGSPITVEMGQVSFDSLRIPVSGPPRQVIDEPLLVGNETLHICALTVGNPHCVVLHSSADEATARRLGPLIENHPAFPNRINVQFLQVLDPANIAIHIWERGVGYTLASGSSSCAAAAAAHRLGWCAAAVTVHCPGGDLQVTVLPGDFLTLTGPVESIAVGRFTQAMLQS